MIIEFNKLRKSDLIVDAIYKGGKAGNGGDDPISKLFPKLGYQGGFRKAKRNDKTCYYVHSVTSLPSFHSVRTSYAALSILNTATTSVSSSSLNRSPTNFNSQHGSRSS